MPIQKDLIKTASSPIRLSSRTKTEKRRILRKAVSTLFSQNQRASDVKVLDTWNKNVQPISRPLGRAKRLLATLSDIKHEDDSDNDNEGILNAFTAIVNPIVGIVKEVDEKEDLVESKFENMDEQDNIHTAYAKLYKVSKKHGKLYRLATKKLNDVELEREEISTKFDEDN